MLSIDYINVISSADNEHKALVTLYNVMVADYFSIIYDIGFSGNKNPVKPDHEVWKIIDLNENSFEELKEKVF